MLKKPATGLSFRHPFQPTAHRSRPRPGAAAGPSVAGSWAGISQFAILAVASISTAVGQTPTTERPPAASAEAPRVASRSIVGMKPASAATLAEAAEESSAAETAPAADEEPVARALKMIAECRERFATVRDYTCTFHKRERINGHLGSAHVMTFKARSQPESYYFKFQNPTKGREAIYVAGKYNGKVLAHDVGLGRFLAGTMHLDPNGGMAMEGCRHPITEAGVGNLIETVYKHWNRELTPEETRVRFHPSMRIGTSTCTLVETVHPQRHPDFLFHMVRLYVDHENGLPIRFEAYDWPRSLNAAPELVEEYTYMDLKLNVGLAERDFDPANKSYAFGRF